LFFALSAVFGITLFCLAALFKSDSSAGRLLIYKICIKIFRESFYSGIGLGNFAAVYGKYQAQYFSSFHPRWLMNLLT
jgi:O-antigen ligase